MSDADVYRVMCREENEDWVKHYSNANPHGLFPALKNAKQAVASTAVSRKRFRLPDMEFKIQKLGVAHTSFAVFDQALEWQDVDV